MNLPVIKKNYFAVLTFVLLLQVLPCKAFCQEQEEGDENSLPDQEAPAPNRSGTTVGSSSPWSSTSSTPASNNNSNSGRPSTSGTASHSAGQRPATTTDIDPGGNPDVPIDSNMTLLFLVASVGFSFWVVKRMGVKTSSSANSK